VSQFARKKSPDLVAGAIVVEGKDRVPGPCTSI
jgi:hypothetical protein